MFNNFLEVFSGPPSDIQLSKKKNDAWWAIRMLKTRAKLAIYHKKFIEDLTNKDSSELEHSFQKFVKFAKQQVKNHNDKGKRFNAMLNKCMDEFYDSEDDFLSMKRIKPLVSIKNYHFDKARMWETKNIYEISDYLLETEDENTLQCLAKAVL